MSLILWCSSKVKGSELTFLVIQLLYSRPSSLQSQDNKGYSKARTMKGHRIRIESKYPVKRLALILDYHKSCLNILLVSVLPPDAQSISTCLQIYSFLNTSLIMLHPQVKCSTAPYNWNINVILLIIWPLLILPHFYMPQLCEVSTLDRLLYFV